VLSPSLKELAIKVGVIATNGSVNIKKERMGAGFLVIDKPGSEVLLDFSAPVSGSFASLRV
jgi:hypothetical protein